MLRIAPLFLLAAMAMPAATEWVRIATPDFEMYTTAGEKRGREAILYFEQVRAFFKTVSRLTPETEFPIRIIAFRNEKQFQPYAPPGGFAAAYYTASRNRDYIVMRDLSEESFPVAIHEYMHLLVRHSGMKFPAWLNEGWADVFSTLKPRAGKTMIGDLLPGRVQTLNSEKWLSFETLTGVTHDSPTYNEKQRAGVFYAESWALTHMLYLSPEYGPKFNDFIAAINSGKSSAEACQAAYGKSSAQVYKDLQSYLSRNALFGALFDAKFEKAKTTVEATPVNETEAGLAVADLLATIRHTDEAKTAYQKIQTEFPNNAEVAKSLGYLAWRDGDREGARKQFRQAYDSGEKDPQMCYHLALLERESHKPLEDIAAPLRRALATRPDYAEARMELGFAFMQAQQWEGAIAALMQLKQLAPEKAVPVFNALSYAWMQRGDEAQARKQAELAIQWSKDEYQTKRAKDLLSYMDRRAAAEKTRMEIAANRAALEVASPSQVVEVAAIPVAPQSPNIEPPARRFGEYNPFVGVDETVVRVEGLATELACEAKGAILHVKTEVGMVSINMPEPDRVLLKHAGADTFEFTCGPQKPFKVIAEYVPDPEKKGGTVGTLRQLEF